MAIDDYFAAPPPPAPPVVSGRVGAAASRLAHRAPQRRSVLTVVLGTLSLVAVGAGIAGYVGLQASQAHEESAAVDKGLALVQRVQLQSALQGAASAEDTWVGTHGVATRALGSLAASGWTAPAGVTVSVVSATGADYCLAATPVSRPTTGAVTEYWSSATGAASATRCG